MQQYLEGDETYPGFILGYNPFFWGKYEGP